MGFVNSIYFLNFVCPWWECSCMCGSILRSKTSNSTRKFISRILSSLRFVGITLGNDFCGSQWSIGILAIWRCILSILDLLRHYMLYRKYLKSLCNCLWSLPSHQSTNEICKVYQIYISPHCEPNSFFRFSSKRIICIGIIIVWIMSALIGLTQIIFGIALLDEAVPEISNDIVTKNASSTLSLSTSLLVFFLHPPFTFYLSFSSMLKKVKKISLILNGHWNIKHQAFPFLTFQTNMSLVITTILRNRKLLFELFLTSYDNGYLFHLITKKRVFFFFFLNREIIVLLTDLIALINSKERI